MVRPLCLLVLLPVHDLYMITHLTIQLTGLPPFYDENTNEMYRKILSDPLRFPENMGSEARDLLSKLLDRDPAKRLGVKGAQDIRGHPFFSRHIDFKKLWAKKIQPPFKPAVVSLSIHSTCFHHHQFSGNDVTDLAGVRY